MIHGEYSAHLKQLCDVLNIDVAEVKWRGQGNVAQWSPN